MQCLVIPYKRNCRTSTYSLTVLSQHLYLTTMDSSQKYCSVPISETLTGDDNLQLPRTDTTYNSCSISTLSRIDTSASRRQLCRLHCKPNYRVCLVKSKQGLLVLLWNILVFGYFGTINNAVAKYTLAGHLQPYASLIINRYSISHQY